MIIQGQRSQPQATFKNNQGGISFQNTGLSDVVELRNISQVYKNDQGEESVVLKDFNLLVEDKPNQGQIVVLLGPSGCGKSTVLRYIAGLATPTSGEILINGKLRQENDKVGMVFQQYSSYPNKTVLENVMFPLVLQNKPIAEAIAKAREMIDLVELTQHEMKYPALLSGGQLQRVAIARSLVSNPNILLMDEPFGALDVKMRWRMNQILLKIWEQLGSTIILVTHDPREAVFLGDDIYFLSTKTHNIVKHLHVNLPLLRDPELQYTREFGEMVRDVDETLKSAEI